MHILDTATGGMSAYERASRLFEIMDRQETERLVGRRPPVTVEVAAVADIKSRTTNAMGSGEMSADNFKAFLTTVFRVGGGLS